eukprot:m.181101 g.181101  ORF g.181101 m.181101 type:complete len:74 (-) comp18441_c0_seq13:86-307(-)
MPARNITVRDCVLWAGRGVSIGSEVSGGIDGVYISDNRLLGPSEHGYHIKTSSDRGGMFWHDSNHDEIGVTGQ